MKYSVKYKKLAEKKLERLDPPVRKRIKNWVEKNLEGCENPRHTGKPLEGEWEGYWRYRVGNYRLVAEIQDDKIIILIVNVDKRNDIYK
ncbi:MAG: type II toxin-antitoxin system RelE/ParE family toxin [Selenomonadaceae bacterium]|nr:type II toxin-antitoxin system RelE/ParE family toxin [Selenomonadaceae bacterium]MBQ4403135.1 type II toxin-antitoxin system RelE/ParE family toxin [Selenomonadaceae bacterium]